MSFQIGANHSLYLAYTNPTTPQTIAALQDTLGAKIGSGVGIEDMTLNYVDLIKDVTDGGSNEKVDVTTRQTARQGFTAELIAASSANRTVQFAYEPRDAAGAYARGDLAVLFYCFAAKETIYAIDLDKDIGTNGCQGIGGNWSIGFSMPKPVKGQVVVDVEFALESYGQLIYSVDGSITDFRGYA